jgi:very-short-patch-repair endonuclease
MRLTAVPRLSRRIEELGGSGRAGVQMLRILMLDSGGESRLEREFLRLLRRHAIVAPKSQIVYRTNGRTLRVDFEFVAHHLVVEVSGKLGHSTDRDRQRDARRRNELQRLGRTVLEFTTADVFADPDYVIATVREHLRVMSRSGVRRSSDDWNRA